MALTLNNNLIPVASSDTSNGYFKFICVGFDINGRVKLVTDRNIQNRQIYGIRR